MYLSKLFFKVFFKIAEIKESENEKVHRTQSVLLKALNKIFPLIKELVLFLEYFEYLYFHRIPHHIKQLKSILINCLR